MAKLNDIAARSSRLRTTLNSTPEGRAVLERLTPPGMIQTKAAIVDFCDFKDWSQGGPSINVVVSEQQKTA